MPDILTLHSKNTQDLEVIRNKLMEKHAELTSRLNQIDNTIHTPLNPDSSEQAVELQNREVLDYLSDEAQSELDQINEALWRLDNGRYGICTQCEQTIPWDRLHAYPFAEMCIQCQDQDGENA